MDIDYNCNQRDQSAGGTGDPSHNCPVTTTTYVVYTLGDRRGDGHRDRSTPTVGTPIAPCIHAVRLIRSVVPAVLSRAIVKPINVCWRWGGAFAESWGGKADCITSNTKPSRHLLAMRVQQTLLIKNCIWVISLEQTSVHCLGYISHRRTSGNHAVTATLACCQAVLPMAGRARWWSACTYR